MGLVSGSSDGTVRVWNAAEGTQLQTLRASDAEVRSIAISPDGKWIAAGIRYGGIKIWNAKNWVKRYDWEIKSDDVSALAFSKENELLIAAGEWNRPGRVETWNLAEEKKTSELAHPGEVLSLAISASNRLIIAGGGDNAASVWWRAGN
jgi:WD40 repeat protein